MKKLITLFLVLALLSISLVNVYAAAKIPSFDDNKISPCYLYTSNLKSELSISSKSGICKSTITVKSGTTKIVVSQKLQKKVDGAWETVTKWSKTFTTISAVYTNSKSSLSAGTYRTRTVAKVYKGSDYEKISTNSTTVKI